MKKILQSQYILIILAPLILFSAILLSGKALFWGTPATQFIPWWDFAWDSILNGQIPLWNPWVGMGAPLIANYQSALFYPPYWLLFIMYAAGGVRLMAWSITILVVLHLAWGGIGIAKLMQEIKVGKLGQTVSGIAFALSGYLVARAGFLSINATVSWLPWVLFFSMQIARNKKKSIWQTGLVLGLMFLAGHAQIAWYVVLLGGFWITFWGLCEHNTFDPLKKLLIIIGKYCAAGIVGIGLSAIQLLPTIEYLSQSARAAEYGFAEAMTYSFWPWRFLTLIVPNLFGNPALGDYWGYGNYWEDALYIGILPLLMAIGVLIRIFKKKNSNENLDPNHRKLSIFLLSIICISFLLALGKNTPIFPFLYKHVPTFNLFQAPTRYSIWAEFSLVILAGIGIDRLKRPTGRRLYWNRLALAGSFAIIGAAVLAAYLFREIETTFISSIGLAGFWGLGTALLLLIKPEDGDSEKSKYWQNALIIFISFELVLAGWGLNPGVKLNFYDVEQYSENLTRSYMSNEVEYDLKFRKFFTFDTFDSEFDWNYIYKIKLPNTGMLKQNETANNFDPMVPENYQIWMDEINKLDINGSDNTSARQYLDLMAVGEIIVSSEDGFATVVEISSDNNSKVKFLNCENYVQNDSDIIDLLFTGEIDLSEEIILLGEIEDMNQDCSGVSKNEIEILEEYPGYLKIITDVSEDGWILWSQVWYPGWIIKINGEKSGPAIKADYLFQAAEIKRGKSEVEFIYDPISFKLGAIISIGSVLVLIFQQRKKLETE